MNTIIQVIFWVGVAAAAPAWNKNEYRWADPSYKFRDHRLADEAAQLTDDEKPWTTAYRMKVDGYQKDPVPKTVPGEPRLEPYNYLVAPDGQLYVNGQKVNPSPSTNDEKYPHSAGWKMFVYHKVTFYLREDGAGKFQIVPVAQKYTIGRVTTPDDVTHEFILRNADGRTSSRDHKELPLYVSNNADHPKEDGWQMFDYAGVRFYLNSNDGHGCLYRLR